MSNESSNGITVEGFARPPPDFDPEQAKAQFRDRHGAGFLDPKDGVEESVEDEIERKIAELADARKGPVTDEEKQEIARKIHSLREGAWLENLKVQLVDKNNVPIEYFNRLAAEHEDTIARVARINARAARRVAERDAQIDALRNQVRDGSTNDSGDGDDHDNENKDLRNKLNVCLEHGAQLQREVQRLNGLVQQEKEKQQGDTNGDSALAECNDRASRLQKEVDATKKDLDTARTTASEFYNEVQSLRQQRIDQKQREDGNKEEIRKLRKDMQDLEEENQKMRNAVAPQGGSNDPEDLRKRILELEAAQKEKDTRISALQAELKTRDETIGNLEARLAREQNTSQPGQTGATPREPSDELHARVAELRASRDHYREMWARGVVTGEEAFRDFWGAVESANRELKELYLGIERLGRVLGLANGVIDTPQLLEKIITEVAGSISDNKETLPMAVVNLRNANILARIRIETLERQLQSARLSRSEAEVRAELGLGNLDHEEIEERVAIRTRTYREYVRTLVAHILNAENEFSELAGQSADGDAIRALVTRFLLATSLPMIRVAQTGRS